MKPAAVIASGAISAIGRGRAAYASGGLGELVQSGIGPDELLQRAGLRRPLAARVAQLDAEEDRAERLLGFAAEQLERELARVLPDWRSSRVGIVVGTSGGGMPSQVACFEHHAAGRDIPAELARRGSYAGPLSALAVLRVSPMLSVQVLAACASSTVALGLGARWLDQDYADLVIAGGYDALSVFIASGFEVLGATTASHPAPFRVERDGMALGEGAALVALVPAQRWQGRSQGFVCGFGARCDAVHVTAPDPEGQGLAGAARAALADARTNPDEIVLVSAHGTATPFNDAAELLAMQSALPGRSRVPALHPFKAVIGHTLGAAGVLESLAALHALETRIAPAVPAAGSLMPELTARLPERNERLEEGAALKLSAAFGGSNAALVLRPEARQSVACPRHSVGVMGVGRKHVAPELELCERRTCIAPAKLRRSDELSLLAVTATSSLLDALAFSPDPRTGVVIGSALATVEINDVFDRRRRERGAASVEPRRFPATSPNLSAGQVSIAFGFHGPSLAVGGGRDAPLQALVVAHDLVRAGDAPQVVVVFVEQVGQVGAALLRAAGEPLPASGAVALLLGAGAEPRLLRSDLLALAPTLESTGKAYSFEALTAALPALTARGGLADSG